MGKFTNAADITLEFLNRMSMMHPCILDSIYTIVLDYKIYNLNKNGVLLHTEHKNKIKTGVKEKNPTFFVDTTTRD